MGGTLNCLASLDSQITCLAGAAACHCRIPGGGGGDTYYARVQGKIHRDIEPTARPCRTGPRLI